MLTDANVLKDNQVMKSARWIFFHSLLLFSLRGQSSENPSADGLMEVSGTVRIIRAHPETEVFFTDLKNSVIIPKTSSHNRILEACEEARKKNAKISLRIDPISRQVKSLGEDSGIEKKADGKLLSTPVLSPGKEGFHPIPSDDSSQ